MRLRAMLFDHFNRSRAASWDVTVLYCECSWNHGIGRLLPAPHSGWPPGLPPHTSHGTRRARMRRWARASAAQPSRLRSPHLTHTTRLDPRWHRSTQASHSELRVATRYVHMGWAGGHSHSPPRTRSRKPRRDRQSTTTRAGREQDDRQAMTRSAPDVHMTRPQTYRLRNRPLSD